MDEDLLKIKKLLLQYVRIIIKEYPKQELTDEQMYIKELEEKLAIMESKLLNI